MMRFVVARAFRVALVRSIVVFGFLAVLFSVFAANGDPVASQHLNPRMTSSTLTSLYDSLTFTHSPWDFPIAFGAFAASVLAAALIHPKRRPAA